MMEGGVRTHTRWGGGVLEWKEGRWRDDAWRMVMLGWNDEVMLVSID